MTFAMLDEPDFNWLNINLVFKKMEAKSKIYFFGLFFYFIFKENTNNVWKHVSMNFFFHFLEKSENINFVFQSFLKKDENYF